MIRFSFGHISIILIQFALDFVQGVEETICGDGGTKEQHPKRVPTEFAGIYRFVTI